MTTETTKTTNTETITKSSLIKEINKILGFNSLDDNENMICYLFELSKVNLKKIRTELNKVKKDISKITETFSNLSDSEVRCFIDLDSLYEFKHQKLQNVIVESGYKI